MNSQKSKYKLLVLLDKSDTAHNTFKSAANLANLIHGSIEVFQVKKTTNLTNSESQITAIRTIQEEDFNRKKELRNILDNISKNEKIPLSFNFTYGNVKNEINNHINDTKPDIVILGRRKKKMISFLGDRLIKNLFKNYNGAILIADNEDAFTSYQEKSIGFLNDVIGFEELDITNDLKKQTNKPNKLFKSNQDTSLEMNTDTIQYKVDANGAPTEDIATLISENNISLLCINKKDDISIKTIEQIKVPVLILNK